MARLCGIFLQIRKGTPHSVHTDAAHRLQPLSQGLCSGAHDLEAELLNSYLGLFPPQSLAWTGPTNGTTHRRGAGDQA